MENRAYIAIDLKSFYASVECVERGLDPLNANLVVADASRTEKTICLAVSPALKAWGVPGRPRLFEVVQKVTDINRQRARSIAPRKLTGRSILLSELKAHPEAELDYIVAPPQMARYVEVSTKIYDIYLKYVSSEDITAYSIDEVFIDATHYLKTYNVTPRELAMRMIRDVLKQTGVTATAGIGTNLYLCKIAMDIEAKHIAPDADGVRIAELDERSYREKLWNHRPLTDFWRVGRGTARRLESHYMYTMGDVARMSVQNEELLYRLFGVNAELLIDHAWGWEPCTLDVIKAYRPESNSISSGQVLQEPYENRRAAVVVREMAEALSLDLVSKRMVTDRVDLVVCFDNENLTRSEIRQQYKGPISEDHYGRNAPKPAHGAANLPKPTSSTRVITEAFMRLFEEKVEKYLLVRRVYVTACHILPEECVPETRTEQLDMFTDYEALERQKQAEEEALRRERSIQEAMLGIKEKFGKNAILKGTNFMDGATGRSRNNQIGGHKAK